MNAKGKIAVVAAGAVGLAAVGAGIARTAGVSSEERVTGSEAEQAARAALRAVGGGTVLEVERQDGDGAGVYEVEVRRSDGSQLEVHLDGGYRPLGTVADDDASGEQDDGAEGTETAP